MRSRSISLLFVLIGVLTVSILTASSAPAATGVNGQTMHYPSIANLLELIGTVIEIGGIFIMIFGAVLSTIIFVRDWWQNTSFDTPYKDYRSNLGRAILLGLEVLIVADIVGTVAVKPSIENLGILGMIVVIRTFLSFTLEVEINGYWPWQEAKMEKHISGGGTQG